MMCREESLPRPGAEGSQQREEPGKVPRSSCAQVSFNALNYLLTLPALPDKGQAQAPQVTLCTSTWISEATGWKHFFC